MQFETSVSLGKLKNDSSGVRFIYVNYGLLGLRRLPTYLNLTTLRSWLGVRSPAPHGTHPTPPN